MYLSTDQQTPGGRTGTEPKRPPRQRRIDCAPREAASPPPDPQTSRGRGTPDREPWTREAGDGQS